MGLVWSIVHVRCGWQRVNGVFSCVSYANLPVCVYGHTALKGLMSIQWTKNLGRLWLAYTELQGDFTCYSSYLLTLGTLHSQNSAYGSLIYMK